MADRVDTWIEDGLPYCDTCSKPCVVSEFFGWMHVTHEHPWGVPKELDKSGHAVTMKRWSEGLRMGRGE